MSKGNVTVSSERKVISVNDSSSRDAGSVSGSRQKSTGILNNQGKQKSSKVVRKNPDNADESLAQQSDDQNNLVDIPTKWKKKYPLGSLSISRNVTKKSGFKSSNVSQETSFSKAVKNKPVVKKSLNRRNTILINDEKESEDLNDKLVQRTKYVDKVDKPKGTKFSKLSEKFDDLLKNSYTEIDAIGGNTQTASTSSGNEYLQKEKIKKADIREYSISSSNRI